MEPNQHDTAELRVEVSVLNHDAQQNDHKICLLMDVRPKNFCPDVSIVPQTRYHGKLSLTDLT